MYIPGTKVEIPYASYKDRVDFNDESFSLTLKNLQKTDSGLYTAITSGESDKNIVTYRVSVIGECDFAWHSDHKTHVCSVFYYLDCCTIREEELNVKIKY